MAPTLFLFQSPADWAATRPPLKPLLPQQGIPFFLWLCIPIHSLIPGIRKYSIIRALPFVVVSSEQHLFILNAQQKPDE